MTLLAPFDGSDLAATALGRAREFGAFTGEDVLVLIVVPDDEEYARERGWVDPGEPFEPGLVAGRLADRATAIAPDATVQSEVTGEVTTSVPTTMDVVRRIREVADEVEASIVFVGSANAGRVSTPITSVGNPVSEDPRYDVHIVRHPD